MGSMFCYNEDDHRREGREDYEYRGHYDSERYNDPWNDCSRYYREGYDEAARREEQIREDERREERQQYEQRQEQQLRQRQEEDYYYEQQREEYERSQSIQEQPEQYRESFFSDDLPF